MSKSLEKMAGGKLERLLKRMTSNPVKSLLLGAGITIAIQSSSAMTVMLVGLVNSGVMELGQTIGVIMGSNIGTTLTAWILSLTGIESESIFVNMLKPENFSPLVALAGIILIMGSKRQKRRDVGRIMVGFSILMYGMELMSGAVSPSGGYAGIFRVCSPPSHNPLLGVLVGAVFTGIIQSSAASVGILQALAHDRLHHLRHGHPHHHGPEYRHLRHRADQLHRRQPQCQAGGRDPHLLQRHRHRRVPDRSSTAAMLIFDFSFLDWTGQRRGHRLLPHRFQCVHHPHAAAVLPPAGKAGAETHPHGKTPPRSLPSWIPCLMRTPSVAISECVSMA